MAMVHERLTGASGSTIPEPESSYCIFTVGQPEVILIDKGIQDYLGLRWDTIFMDKTHYA